VIHYEGRARIRLEKAVTTGASLHDFWIHKLEEVIIWLKLEKSRLEIQSLVLEPISSALGLSASNPTVLLKSSYPKELTLSVQEGQPTLSWVVKKSNLKLKQVS